MDRQRPPEGVELGRLRVPVSEAVAKKARDLLAMVGDAWRLDSQTVYTAKVVVTELVTNVFQHAQDASDETVTVVLSHSAEMLVVEVQDQSQRPPVIRDAEDLDQSGRGLLIVSGLGDGIGYYLTAVGKSVWVAFKCGWPLGYAT